MQNFVWMDRRVPNRHEHLLMVSLGGPQVAVAVAKTAIDEGVAQIEEPEDLEQYLAARMWKPVYDA